MADTLSSNKHYHFIRLMGRSASQHCSGVFAADPADLRVHQGVGGGQASDSAGVRRE
jgi:hypothetical protein